MRSHTHMQVKVVTESYEIRSYNTLVHVYRVLDAVFNFYHGPILILHPDNLNAL